MLRLKNGVISDDQGRAIKRLDCPLGVTRKSLSVSGNAHSGVCRECNRIVHDTDYMSEEQVIELFKGDPHACVSIHPLNPLFELLEEK